MIPEIAREGCSNREPLRQALPPRNVREPNFDAFDIALVRGRREASGYLTA